VEAGGTRVTVVLPRNGPSGGDPGGDETGSVTPDFRVDGAAPPKS
jgi:hypothetical protein